MDKKEIFVKRLKSWAWRTAMMVIALFAQWLLENLNLLDMSPIVTTVLGLLLGEVSKFLNVDMKKLASS